MDQKVARSGPARTSLLHPKAKRFIPSWLLHSSFWCYTGNCLRKDHNLKLTESTCKQVVDLMKEE